MAAPPVGAVHPHEVSNPMIIHTPATRRRIARHLDRLNVALVAMKDGAALHLCLDRGAIRWWLSSGQSVDPAVAQALVRHTAVVGVGDALFGDVASQTYRYVDET
jgi:hypothetical protein